MGPVGEPRLLGLQAGAGLPCRHLHRRDDLRGWLLTVSSAQGAGTLTDDRGPRLPQARPLPRLAHFLPSTRHLDMPLTASAASRGLCELLAAPVFAARAPVAGMCPSGPSASDDFPWPHLKGGAVQGATICH